MNEKPLGGLRVLDFTWMLAGPYATRIFADFGAEVIKVQSKKTAKGAESNLTPYFNAWNRNKRGITLDLSRPEAREIVFKLTAKSDVVIENFSPRVMPNWGLNYEKLKEVRPDLIMLSMSAMGQGGPWRDYVAFAPTLHALSGLTFLTSFEKDAPVGLGYAYADIVAGLYAAMAVLAALEHRDRTGQGQYIDLSEYEAICTLMGPVLLDASVNQKEIPPQGNHPDYVSAAPYGCYRCSGEDRWCVIAVSGEEEWQSLCQVLGHPGWTREGRFATGAKRKENRKELDDLLTKWTVLHTAEEAVNLLQEAGVSAGVVQNAEDLSRDPQLMARNFFVQLEHPVLGKIVSDRSPIRFEGDETIQWRAAPQLGEGNRYVFLELLGFTEEELSHYVERGIIG
ncbi:MAG TPA: CoA transferase [Thermodesulfobacteriota bacterium]|nr:CoA transferase [Thermodesulfobacteriota bacterium]